MKWFRFSIAGLMALIIYVAIGLAAFRKEGQALREGSRRSQAGTATPSNLHASSAAPLLPFDAPAASIVDKLRTQRAPLATMDVRIAATALSRRLILLIERVPSTDVARAAAPKPHSILDIPPVRVGAVLRPLTSDDDLLGEMLEDRA